MSRAPLCLLLVLLPLAACGSKAAPASETTGATTAAPADPAIDACRKTFVRQRECTDVFIPALVDLRVRLDVPAGIAAEDKANGRDALVGMAKTEWAKDSTDDAIAATCDKMTASMAPDMKTKLAEGAGQCLAKAECAAFVECEMPMLEQHMRMPAPPAQ